MPSQLYRAWFSAIRHERRVGYIYDGAPREGCPHVLGLDKNGKEKVLVRRVVSGQNSPEEWRCLFVSDTGGINAVKGDWLEGNSHKVRNSCVVVVHIDVNRAAEQFFDWTSKKMKRPAKAKKTASSDQGSRKKKKPRWISPAGLS